MIDVRQQILPERTADERWTGGWRGYRGWSSASPWRWSACREQPGRCEGRLTVPPLPSRLATVAGAPGLTDSHRDAAAPSPAGALPAAETPT